MAQSLFLEKDSPVDFLYLDRQRVASLAGQLSDRGMLVGLKSVFQKSQSKEGKASGTVFVASTEGKISGTSSESSEETYDPFWTHAYSFLRDLEENFAVPLDAARMGSLVKFDGLVQFLDMKIISNLWEPTLRAFSVLRAAAQPDNLTISSDALVMKFGAVIDGIWTVVGIVDGRIGDSPQPFKINPMLDGVVTAMAGFREIVGRPRDHWGLTPIATYAPLRGAVETEAEAQAGDSTPSENQEE
jgi:hypothetical protein